MNCWTCWPVSSGATRKNSHTSPYSWPSWLTWCSRDADSGCLGHDADNRILECALGPDPSWPVVLTGVQTSARSVARRDASANKVSTRRGCRPRLARRPNEFYLARLMGSRVEQIDHTNGHMLPESEIYLRGLLDTFDASKHAAVSQSAV